MSLKTDPFVSIAQRLRAAADAFASVAELADVATDAAPKSIASHSTDGVKRPVEDLVIARDENGVYAALNRTRSHAAQAALHAEAAHLSAKQAVRALDVV